MNAAYNATVLGFQDVHNDLRILRVRCDGGSPPFVAGQYVTLGLANDAGELIRRPYSISCTMLSSSGKLVVATRCPYLEFYITRVRNLYGQNPSGLSPLLFALQSGDRLRVGTHAHGHYTLKPVQRRDDVVLMATGTGEAPHNAMIADLLDRGHEGKIVCVTCVRYRHDLGYRETHAELMNRYGQYRYIPLTTREPENFDSSRGDYVGKQYVQDFLTQGRLDAALGGKLDPGRSHIYLCGNPAMVGAPALVEGRREYPLPRGMVELLEARGFRVDSPGHTGNIHFENYWQPNKEKADVLS